MKVVWTLPVRLSIALRRASVGSGAIGLLRNVLNHRGSASHECPRNTRDPKLSGRD